MGKNFTNISSISYALCSNPTEYNIAFHSFSVDKINKSNTGAGINNIPTSPLKTAGLIPKFEHMHTCLYTHTPGHWCLPCYLHLKSMSFSSTHFSIKWMFVFFLSSSVISVEEHRPKTLKSSPNFPECKTNIFCWFLPHFSIFFKFLGHSRMTNFITITHILGT